MHRHAIVTDRMLAQGDFTCRAFQVHFIKTYDTWRTSPVDVDGGLGLTFGKVVHG